MNIRKIARLSAVLGAGALVMAFTVPAAAAGNTAAGNDAVALAAPAAPSDTVEPVDIRLASLITEEAEVVLGERYVDLWMAEDQLGFVVGVVGLTEQDQAWANEWSDIARLTLVDSEFSRAELDAAAEQALEAVGEDAVSVGVDYRDGQVLLGVEDEVVEEALAAVDEVDGLEAVEDGVVAELAGDEIPVEVSVEEVPMPTEAISGESIDTGPLRAGKRIYNVTQGGSYCTANVLVTKGTARQMISAGHCGAAGNTVRYAGANLGTIQSSSWYAAKNGAEIVGDAASHAAPTTARASLFRTPTQAWNVVGWGDAIVGAVVCSRGVSSGVEKCGVVKAVGLRIEMGSRYVDPGMRYLKNTVAVAMPTIPGDSGGPLYYKGIDSMVVVGILSGSNPSMSYWTPMRTGLSYTGTQLVRANGLGVPVVTTSMGTPFAQVITSPDFTGDGRGEVMALTKNGRLVVYQTLAGGKLAGPARLMGTGMANNRIIAPGDWNRDGIADVMSITPNGNLYLRKGLGGGSLDKPVQIGSSWKALTVFAAGDLNGDGIPDLLAIVNATGELRLYPGNGTGGFKPRVVVGSSWKSMTL
ncbi:MAG: FG-GAP-like repeat-containing protein, partial [Micrococcales bacterium]|nr:FG-GAP-like repeat-containing protein [Micrococcales bacterium]